MKNENKSLKISEKQFEFFKEKLNKKIKEEGTEIDPTSFAITKELLKCNISQLSYFFTKDIRELFEDDFIGKLLDNKEIMKLLKEDFIYDITKNENYLKIITKLFEILKKFDENNKKIKAKEELSKSKFNQHKFINFLGNIFEEAETKLEKGLNEFGTWYSLYELGFEITAEKNPEKNETEIKFKITKNDQHEDFKKVVNIIISETRKIFSEYENEELNSERRKKMLFETLDLKNGSLGENSLFKILREDKTCKNFIQKGIIENSKTFNIFKNIISEFNFYLTQVDSPGASQNFSFIFPSFEGFKEIQEIQQTNQFQQIQFPKKD